MDAEQLVSLVRRGAVKGTKLDAAGKRWGYNTIINVNIVFCTLSLCGSLVMILSFIISSKLRKIRHRLILGLAINDLIQSLTVLVPSIYAKTGGNLPQATHACRADAFLYVALVVANALWALAIAVATYTMLVHPLSYLTRCLHRTWVMPAIWGCIWLIGIINAIIGVAQYSVSDTGGSCFFPNGPQDLYGNLVIFVPRTLALAIVIPIYIRMVIFFRRRSSRAKRASQSNIDRVLPSRRLSNHLPSFWITNNLTRQGSASSQKTASETKSECPASTKEGDSNPATFYPVLTRASSTTGTVKSISSFQDKFRRYRAAHWTRKPSKDSDTTVVAPPSALRNPQRAYQPPLVPEVAIQELSEEAITTTIGRCESIEERANARTAMVQFEEQLAMFKDMPPSQATRRYLGPGPSPKPQQGAFERAEAASSEEGDGGIHPLTVGTSHRSSSKRYGDNLSTDSDPAEDIAPTQDQVSGTEDNLVEGLSAAESSHSAGPDPRLPTESEDTQQGGSPDVEAAAPVRQRRDSEQEVGIWEALSDVQQSFEAADAASRADTKRAGKRLSPAEQNKRVSRLMMLYPLAYTLIVAVSIGRTANNLVRQTPPSPALSILNRVLILSTGMVDAIIFTFIEWRFRRSTRST